MDTGDVVASTIATVSLIATAILAYRQKRLQAKLTAIEQTRQRQEAEARQHADVQATRGRDADGPAARARQRRPGIGLGGMGQRVASRF